MADDNEGSRFATVNEAEFKQLLLEKDSLNTRRATDSSVRTFRAYLKEKGNTQDFENLSKEDLDKILSKFYTKARQENGEQYKKSSLFALRHEINRHLGNVDLIHDTEFKESNKAFSAVVKNLKRQGLVGVEHYPPTDEEGLVKMYKYFDLNDNVKLQEKVFVDIMIYFGRRGRENLHELK